MRKNHVISKYILLGTTAVIIVGIIVASILANKQNERFEAENQVYQQAVELYRSENFEGAKLLIKDLVIERSKSEVVNHLAALIYARNDEYTSAAVYMQKALDINPYNVEEPIFMFQFGEILLRAERIEDAKVVLNHCKESNWEPEGHPEYQAQVQDMLKQIENM